MKEYVIGSNTEKIVRWSKVPVIAIKKYVKGSSIKNIIFPNTLERDQEDLVMKVKALQEFFKATLHILYVNTPANFRNDGENKKRLEEFSKRFMIKNFTLNIYNDIHEEVGVLNFSKSVKADMIAISTHGRKGLSHLLSGSIAEDLVNHIECPIWTSVVK
ncbi:MAG: universal stress protein [Flammeovirgaceae bacterium]|nr:universal stress protein [Flammeovirgaceae bacterium]